MNVNKNAIYCEHIYKSYRNNDVLKDLNMSVPYGSIYGFIGENGAGKTSTLKLFTGLSTPSSGKLSVLDSETIADFKKKRTQIGSLIESPLLYPNMTAFQNLKICCIQRDQPINQITELLRLVGLSPTLKTHVKHYSLGMRQRLGIAIALLGNPQIVILDEPMNGLDPTGMSELRQLITLLNKEKEMTFIISSHLLNELFQLSNNFGFIYDGYIVKEITKKTLSCSLKNGLYVRFDIDSNDAIEKLNALLKSNFTSPPSVKALSNTEILIDINEYSVNVLNKLVYQNLGSCIQDTRIETENFEDYYLNLISSFKN